MAVWIIIAIVLAVIVVALGAWWMYVERHRSTELQRRFGPEYDREVARRGSTKDAERSLSERSERREELDIHALSAASRERYLARWQSLQATFVDDPSRAVEEAQHLTDAVLDERGYPKADFDRRAEDVSVDHPVNIERYRRAHGVLEASDRGDADTETLQIGRAHV